jgi:hypothetical protein
MGGRDIFWTCVAILAIIALAIWIAQHVNVT